MPPQTTPKSQIYVAMHRRHLPNNNKHYAHKTMCVSTRKWLRAFTAKEIIYTLVEAILLLLCVLFLVYLVLHLSVCPTTKKKSCGRSREEQSVNATWGESLDINSQRRMNAQDGNNNTANVGNDEHDDIDTDIFPNATSQRRFNEANYVLISSVAINDTAGSQLKMTKTNKNVKLSETKDQGSNQSNSGEEEKTFSVEYSDEDAGPNNVRKPKLKHCKLCEEARLDHERGKCDCGACASNRTGRNKPRRSDVTILETKFTDDDAASELHKSLVLALVKAEADDTFTYTCVVTIVSEFWTLGAATCVRDLSADTLGLYFLVERFGEAAMGSSHGVSEAARGGGGGGALALRAGGSLLGRGGKVARLAQPLDHLLLVLGDTFTALGYGNFRSIQPRHEDLRLRQTCINWLVEEKCGSPPQRTGQPPFPLCGGVLYGGGSPCYYCGGTPLFLGDVLYGVAGGEEGCGAACPPRHFVTTPDILEWLDALLQADDAAKDGDRELDEYHNDEY